MKCIKCNGELVLNEHARITQEFRGERLIVQSPAYECVKCHNHMLHGRQGDDLCRRAADAYRQKHKLLTSVQIKECRRQKDMTQEEFAAFLQVSPVSIKRWETWQVQEPIYDQRIREKCGLTPEGTQFNDLPSLSIALNALRALTCEPSFSRTNVVLGFKPIQPVPPVHVEVIPQIVAVIGNQPHRHLRRNRDNHDIPSAA